jgi:hypothetical protein
MKPTWTLLPDIDAPNPKRDVEQEQAADLKARVPKLWDALSKRQMEEEQ